MIMLSGRWTLRAIRSEAGWVQGVRVAGSVAHDGDHVMVLGSEIQHVEGASFSVAPQALDPDTGLWIESREQSRFGWDDQTGLTLTISADDVTPADDRDYDDLVVLCLAEDDVLLSPNSGVVRPDLTIPENLVDFVR